MNSIFEGIISIFDSFFGFKRLKKPSPPDIKFEDINKGTSYYWSNDPNYQPPKDDYFWSSTPKRK